MAPVAERAVHCDCSGLRVKDFEEFRHHDRAVSARRRLARGEYFRDGLTIALRLVLLVLVLKAARMPARVPWSAAVRWGGLGGCVRHGAEDTWESRNVKALNELEQLRRELLNRDGR